MNGTSASDIKPQLELTAVMPPMIPPVMPFLISGVSDGMGHDDCCHYGTNHDGSDYQPIRAARRWGRNRASRNYHRRNQRKERFSH